MAKIWYVREGPRPNNASTGPQLSLDRCITLFRAFEIKYLGLKPPEFSSNRNNFVEYRDPNYVVLEIDSSEAVQNKPTFNKEGFYLVVGLRPGEAGTILKQE